MLDHYIEQSICDQSELIVLFFDTPIISLSEIRQQTGLTPAQIRQTIRELNDLFAGQVIITVERSTVSSQFTKLSCKENLLHHIYDQSNILHLLRFLITNTHKPLTYYAQKRFISTSSAYRLRETILPLLEELQLGLDKNTIIGDEYRIRYLIATLHAKFGIKIYHLSSEDRLIIRQFLFDSATNLRSSNLLAESFVFYDILLALSWKRYDYEIVIPPSGILTQLKDLFVYQAIKDGVKSTIEPLCQLKFQQGDIDYLYLIYLTTFNSFAGKRWTPAHEEHALLIFKNNALFQELLHAIVESVPVLEERHDDLVKILIYFTRYFILDLQLFIPEKNTFPLDRYQGSPAFFMVMEHLVADWLNKIGASHLNKQHFFLLCNHLEQLLKNAQPELTVVLIATDYINLHLLTDLISEHFSSKSVAFYSYYLFIDDIYQIKSLNPDLIITHQRLIPFVKEELVGDVAVVDFSYVNSDLHINNIQKIIQALKESKYQQAMENYLKETVTKLGLDADSSKQAPL